MIDPQIKPATPFAEAQLSQIEEILGWSLPEDYKAFARTYGGAFVGGCLDGNAERSILGFRGPAEALQTMALLSDFVAEGFFPFASCELGGLYLLSRDESVYYTVQWGATRTTTRVADRFGDMMLRIVVRDDV